MALEPVRFQPNRKVKKLDQGLLAPKALLQRVIREPAQQKPSIKPKPLQERVDPDHQLLLQFNEADPFALIRIDQNAYNENIQCDICLDDEDGEGDELVVCELCLVAVHQSCYGGDIRNALPPNNVPWYCLRCQTILKSSNLRCTQIRCEFCPDLDGAMKPIDVPKSNNQGIQRWAHVICVNWTPGVWWANENDVAQVCGRVPQELLALKCSRCKNLRGTCIPCDWKNCQKSYHVRCAVKKDMIEGVEQMLDGLGGRCANYEFPLFCSDHQARGRKEYRMKGLSAIVTRVKPQRASASPGPYFTKQKRKAPGHLRSNKSQFKRNRNNQVGHSSRFIKKARQSYAIKK